MKRNFPQAPFERYADDGVIHCRSKEEAYFIKEKLAERFEECKLELHPIKTRIVYCKDKDRNNNKELNNLISLDTNLKRYTSSAEMRRYDITSLHLYAKCNLKVFELKSKR